MTPGTPSQESLLAEILAEAERTATATLDQAREQGQALRSKAAAEAADLTAHQRELGRLEAERRRALVRASAAIQVDRLALLGTERLLDELARQARERLLALGPAERLAVTARLAADAVGRLDADRFVVKVCPGDPPLEASEIQGAVAALARRPPSTIAVVLAPDLGGPGPWVESADGHQVWDNRLLQRLARFWPELRSQIAARLARPVGTGQPGESA